MNVYTEVSEASSTHKKKATSHHGRWPVTWVGVAGFDSLWRLVCQACSSGVVDRCLRPGSGHAGMPARRGGLMLAGAGVR